MTKNKKKIIWITVVILVIVTIATTVGLAGNNKTEEIPLKEREYTASVGDITVGIDASGKLETQKVEHTFEKDAVIEKYYVKVGDSVKKGDSIAEISLNYINEKQQDAKTRLSTANANLKKAKSDYSLYQLQANKKNKDIADASRFAYEEKVNQSNNLIAAQENQINALNVNITSMQEQIDNLKTQETNRSTQILEWQTQIADLEAQITSLQAEITALKADVSVDNAGKILELEGKISQINNEITTLKNQINVLNNTDFASQVNTLNTQKAENTAQKDKAMAELNTSKASYNSLQTARDKELTKEKEDLSLQTKQDNAQLSLLQSGISTAQVEVEKIEEEIKKLDDLNKNKTLIAQIDGVVTALGYVAGDSVVQNKAAAEIGNLSILSLKLVIEPEDIGNIEIDQNVEFYADALPTEILTGKVLSRTLVPNTEGKYEVIVSVDKNEFELLEGMSVAATLIVKDKKDILTLSNKAIKMKEGKQTVKMRDKKGDLYEVEITTGFSNGSITEILSGLKDGDVVISEG